MVGSMSSVRIIVLIIFFIIGVVIWFMILDFVLELYKIGSNLKMIVVVVIMMGWICNFVLCSIVLVNILVFGKVFFFLYLFISVWYLWLRYISIMIFIFIVILVKVMKFMFMVMEKLKFLMYISYMLLIIDNGNVFIIMVILMKFWKLRYNRIMMIVSVKGIMYVSFFFVFNIYLYWLD